MAFKENDLEKIIMETLQNNDYEGANYYSWWINHKDKSGLNLTDREEKDRSKHILSEVNNILSI